MDYYDEYVAECRENIKNFVGETVSGSYSPKEEPNPGDYKGFSGILKELDINNDFPIICVETEKGILKLGLGRCDRIPDPGESATPDQCFNELSRLVSNRKVIYNFWQALGLNKTIN